MHSRPFWSHFCPLHLLSHTAPCLCLMATSSLMLWSLLPGPVSSSGPNEYPCSLQVLVSKSPSPGSFQNSVPIPRQLFCSLIPGGVTAPRTPWDGVTPHSCGHQKSQPRQSLLTSGHTPFCSTLHPTCPISFTTPSLPGAKGQGHYSKLQSWGQPWGVEQGGENQVTGSASTAAGLQGQVTLETQPLEWEWPTHKVQGQPSGGQGGGWRC